MLNEFSISVYCKVLRLLCILKLIPYEWDSKNRRFLKGKVFSWTLFNIHFLMNAGFTVFAIFRLAQNTNKKDFPLLQRILNTAWIGIYMLTVFCHYQIHSY